MNEDELIREIGALLDEVYMLRAVCAQQAAVQESLLQYTTISAGARRSLGVSRELLTEAARGHAIQVGPSRPTDVLEHVGASGSLTRHEFCEERGLYAD